MHMNNKLKMLWIEALRSGQYRQGLDLWRVKADGQVYHTAIGVLADVIVNQYPDQFHWVSDAFENNLRYKSPGMYQEEYGEDCYILQVVAGLSAVDIDYFTECNDLVECDFAQIADEILTYFSADA